MSDPQSTQSTDDHTPHRPLRIPEEEWKPFGERAGARGRTKVVRQFIRWYNRAPGAELPDRPSA